MLQNKIYNELESLIVLLKSDGNDRLAKILEHRIYKISWTSSTELLENIQSILNDFAGENIGAKNKDTLEKVKFIIKEIEAIISH